MQDNSVFFGDQVKIIVHQDACLGVQSSECVPESQSSVLSVCLEGEALGREDCFTIVDISDRACVSRAVKALRAGDVFLLADASGKFVGLNSKQMLVVGGNGISDAWFTFSCDALTFGAKGVTLSVVSGAEFESGQVLYSDSRFYHASASGSRFTVVLKPAQHSPVSFCVEKTTHCVQQGAVAAFENLAPNHSMQVTIESVGHARVNIGSLCAPPLSLLGCNSLSTGDLCSHELSLSNGSTVTLNYLRSGMTHTRNYTQTGFLGRIVVFLVVLAIAVAVVLNKSSIVTSPELYLSLDALQERHNPVRFAAEVILAIFIGIFHKDQYMRRVKSSFSVAEPVVWVFSVSRPAGLGLQIRGLPNLTKVPTMTVSSSSGSSTSSLPKPILCVAASEDSSRNQESQQTPMSSRGTALGTPGPRRGAKVAPPKNRLPQTVEAAQAIAGCIAFGQQLLNPGADSVPSGVSLAEQTAAAQRRALPQDLRALRNAVFCGPARVSVKSYAPVLFAELRRLMGVDDQEQYSALTFVTPEQVHGDRLVHHALAGLAQGSSRALFGLHFLDQDEVHAFLELAPRYIDYVTAQPQSLLARYLGVFRVQAGDKTEVYVALVARAAALIVDSTETNLRLKHDGFRQDSAAVHHMLSGTQSEASLERVFNVRPEHRDQVAMLIAADAEFLRRQDRSGYTLLCTSHSHTPPLVSTHAVLAYAPEGVDCYSFELSISPLFTARGADKYARAMRDYVDIVLPASSSIIVTSIQQFERLLDKSESQLRQVLPPAALDAFDAKPSPGALVLGIQGERYVIPPRGGIKIVY